MGMGSPPHLVEEQGPPVRGLEEPRLVRHRPGEAALLVPEELALQEVLRDGAAVDGHERLAGPGSLIVDVVGHQLLAGPRFAGDVDRRLAAGELRDSRAGSPHGLGIADEASLRLGPTLRDAQGLADHGPEPAEVDRLGDEVEDTRLVADAKRIYNSLLEHLG